jgi:hypothetical protein
VTGVPVRGSWWSHAQAHSVFDVLESLEPDTTIGKLVAGKQTLVHRSRWPALAAVGDEGAAWQYDDLPPDACVLVDQVIAADAPMRTDALVAHGARRRADVVRDVERRLLLHASEVHTESGRHAKVLQPWATWARAEGITPVRADAASGRATFEDAVRTMAPDRVAKLLPWPTEESS